MTWIGGVTIRHVLKMFEALADAGPPAVTLSSTRQILLQACKGLLMPAVNMISRLPQLKFACDAFLRALSHTGQGNSLQVWGSGSELNDVDGLNHLPL